MEQSKLEAKIKELEGEISRLEALVKYWKWEAVKWGSPEFDATFTDVE